MAGQEELYAAVADYATTPLYTDSERLAVEYAERFAVAHTGLDQEFYDRLLVHYTPEQVVDMTLAIGSWVALGRFNTVLDLHVACPLVL